MLRVLEPELMEDKEQVIAYAHADFTDSIGWYTDTFLEKFPHAKQILDVGCGPADVPIHIAIHKKDAHVVALDGSSEMISYAQKLISEKYPKVQSSIELYCGRLQEFNPQRFSFDAIISKDFLHHLENPMDLWSFIRQHALPGTALYHMDLLRPNSVEDAKNIVERVAGEGHPILKQDFYNSLLAAFTLDEIKEQLLRVGLHTLKVSKTTTGRHFIIEGEV